MKIPHSFRRSGFVLPSLLMVTLILLVVATAILGSGTSSLRVATFDQQSDQAIFAAEAGLVRAAEEFAREGSIAQPYQRNLEGADSQFNVIVYENSGAVDMQVPGGPVIPPSTAYLMAEGISQNGTRRKAGALFTMGLEAFKVGALGKQMTVGNADFDAYNSDTGPYDPNDVINDLPLLASNTNDTADGPTFDFTDAEVKGDVFVGPGGDPVAQVLKTGSTVVGDVTAMAKAIELADIEVPVSPDGGGDLNVAPLGLFQLLSTGADGIHHFSDGLGLDFEVDPSQPYPNNLLLPPHLEWFNATSTGTDADGNSITITTATIQEIGSPGHRLEIDKETSGAFYEFQANDGSHPGPEVTQTNPDLRSVIFGGGTITPLPSVTNPTTLVPGHYNSVSVEDGNSGAFSKDGTYVIKNLNITGNGKLGLLPDGDKAIIYVTESLTVEGEDAIFNDTQKASNLQVFYTGSAPVQLAGGSRSYLTLVAPNADVSLESLTSADTEFFGALVGVKVAINNAKFHFDTATAGIGTGTQGSALSVLHRHRL